MEVAWAAAAVVAAEADAALALHVAALGAPVNQFLVHEQPTWQTKSALYAGHEA